MRRTMKQSVKSGTDAASQRWPRDEAGKPMWNPRQIAGARASSSASDADDSLQLPLSEPLTSAPGMVEPEHF